MIVVDKRPPWFQGSCHHDVVTASKFISRRRAKKERRRDKARPPLLKQHNDEKVAVTPSIELVWWIGLAFWKAESKLYRSRHYSASLEQPLPKESVKNGVRKPQAEPKSRLQPEYSTIWSKFDKNTTWQPLESSWRDESNRGIIAAPLPAVESQITVVECDEEHDRFTAAISKVINAASLPAVASSNITINLLPHYTTFHFVRLSYQH